MCYVVMFCMYYCTCILISQVYVCMYVCTVGVEGNGGPGAEEPL